MFEVGLHFDLQHLVKFSDLKHFAELINGFMIGELLGLGMGTNKIPHRHRVI